MTTSPTFMRQEIEEIPEAVSRFLANSGDTLRQGGALLRERDPSTVVTIARGSSSGCTGARRSREG